MPSSTVELYAGIRRDARAGMSVRAIERKHGAGWRTIVKVMSSAWPEERNRPPPRARNSTRSSRRSTRSCGRTWTRPCKQRHTITRIYRRLIDEHGMTDMSYPMARAYVAERKPQIRGGGGTRPCRGVRAAVAPPW